MEVVWSLGLRDAYPAEVPAFQPPAGSAFWLSGGRVTGDGTEKGLSLPCNLASAFISTGLAHAAISSFTGRHEPAMLCTAACISNVV